MYFLTQEIGWHMIHKTTIKTSLFWRYILKMKASTQAYPLLSAVSVSHRIKGVYFSGGKVMVRTLQYFSNFYTYINKLGDSVKMQIVIQFWGETWISQFLTSSCLTSNINLSGPCATLWIAQRKKIKEIFHTRLWTETVI